MKSPAFIETTQIGMVVRDVEATARRFEEEFGIGPWNFMDMDREMLGDDQEFGKPADPACRIAAVKIGSVWWELVQPLTNEGVAAQWLAEKGEGVYHIAVRAANFDETVTSEKANGRELAMEASFGDVNVVYLDTQDRLGTIIEIFNKLPGE